MNKQINKLFLSLAVLLLTILAIPSFNSEAAKKPTVLKKETRYFLQNNPTETLCTNAILSPKNLSDDAIITNAKSSNKKIKIRVKDGVSPYISFQLHKNLKDGAKTLLTFTVEQNGKKYKCSSTITFKKAPSRFKTFKINGKECTKMFKGKNIYYLSTKKSKFKLTYKIVKNMKVATVHAYYNMKDTKKYPGNGKDTKAGYLRKSYNSGDSISTKNLTHLTIYTWTTKCPASQSKNLSGHYLPLTYNIIMK